jgi:F0F1-type ATP synthase membrane subunit b/b'
LDKVVSRKLVSPEDARFIEEKAAQYEADGDKPIVAARAAVNEMIANTQAAGEHVIEQIGEQRPDAIKRRLTSGTARRSRRPSA